jgi:tRNA threonylcarbamoyladenosine biosynthesis protein TsaB
MLLLAADTSGKNGSITLAQCEPDGACNVLEVATLEGGTFSAQLIPQVAALLAAHGFSKQDIGAFAACSGPGSFTGLRVGLAAIKALAEVTGKPVAAVSMLEAVATCSQSHGKVIAALDAGRRELYVGEYDNGVLASEYVTAQESFAPKATVVTPDRNVEEAARAKGAPVEEIERPRSDVIARLGWKKILSGNTISSEALDANYIRRTDAEIVLKP